MRDIDATCTVGCEKYNLAICKRLSRSLMSFRFCASRSTMTFSNFSLGAQHCAYREHIHSSIPAILQHVHTDEGGGKMVWYITSKLYSAQA